MSIVRTFLAALLALSLAVTPALARAAFPVMDAPAQASQSLHDQMTAMADCHRAMQHEAAPQPAKVPHHGDSHHKNCPDCDKRGSCDADLCQLKCFKVLSTVASAARVSTLSGQRFPLPAFAALEPQSCRPQPPPPRI